MAGKLTGSNNVINRFTLSRVPPLCLSTTLATTASTAKPMSNPMSFPKFSQRPTPTMVSAMATISCREFCILVFNITPNLIFRYLFPILMGLFRPLPSDDIAFSMRMVELLTSFARTGKPSIVMGEDQPPFIWDHVNAANASHLNIGNMMMMDQVPLCQGHLKDYLQTQRRVFQTTSGWHSGVGCLCIGTQTEATMLQRHLFSEERSFDR